MMLGIDVELQKYGEELMKHKVGSIVAIEPSSGEILAAVSSPNFDPNLLSFNPNRGEITPTCLKDTLKPLLTDQHQQSIRLAQFLNLSSPSLRCRKVC